MATTAPLTLVQQSPQEKRRQALATAMMGGALQYRPMRTGWEALGSLANAYVGAKMGEAADTAFADRRQAAREKLAEALTNRANPPAPYGSGQDAFYGTLATNPDTADLAAQMKLNQVIAEQNALMRPPNLTKMYDPASPTQTSLIDPRTGVSYGYGPPGSQGVQVGFGPGGTLTSLSVGGTGIGPAGEISTPTTGVVSDVQKRALNSDEIYNRLNRINQLNRPEYQTYGGRGKAKLYGFLEKIDLGNLSPQDREWLRGFTTYQSSAYQNLTQTLKEMSGAAVNPEEAKRQLMVIPDPGEGILDGDSATQFQAKIDEGMRYVRQNMLRYNVWMKVGDRGGNAWDMPFSQVGAYLRSPDGAPMINEYANGIEAEMAPLYSDPVQLREAVKQRVKQELWFM